MLSGNVFRNIRNEKTLTMDSLERGARLGFGLTILILPLLCLLLYLPILLIFFIDKEFRKASAYIIMTHIGVLDALQLVIHSYSGVLVIANVDLGPILNKIPKVSQKIAVNILPGDRCDPNRTVVLRLGFHTISHAQSPYFHSACKMVPRASIHLCILRAVRILLPKLYRAIRAQAPANVDEQNRQALLAVTSRAGREDEISGNYLVLAIVVLSVITYVSIFTYIGCFSYSKLSKREFRITIQVSLLVLYFLFSFVYWTYLMPWFGPSVVADFFSCLVWVIMNGIHPIIYLVFNE
ncbi:hypothetical protein ANCCAN_01824 [Ancylostoma caninum]|uniref:G protein-coupled receptor n=1 Tax=Ancylostoma caninum TaxID=29170 RepID=A0A368H613_ANCCA|nr:hypothetical protein ANCCAN_01824 [Ancylostoma caninum]